MINSIVRLAIFYKNVIKKGKQNVSFKFGRVKFRDMLNFFGSATILLFIFESMKNIRKEDVVCI